MPAFRTFALFTGSGVDSADLLSAVFTEKTYENGLFRHRYHTATCRTPGPFACMLVLSPDLVATVIAAKLKHGVCCPASSPHILPARAWRSSCVQELLARIHSMKQDAWPSDFLQEESSNLPGIHLSIRPINRQVFLLSSRRPARVHLLSSQDSSHRARPSAAGLRLIRQLWGQSPLRSRPPSGPWRSDHR